MPELQHSEATNEDARQGPQAEAEDNPIIGRIKEAEAKTKEIIEAAEREAAETMRQARMKAQQIADEPIEVSGFYGGSERLESIRAQVAAIKSENEKATASMRESAGKRLGEAADFIVSLVMEG